LLGLHGLQLQRGLQTQRTVAGTHRALEAD
jgi:hypothetical protein